jgi:integrase
MALAGRLVDFLVDRNSMEPAYGLLTNRTAAMLKEDATEAGLPLVDDQGRELVFHSLRHTLRTELVRARVTEAVIDRIMRHKPAGVGQRFYTHVTDFEIREAIERLPEYRLLHWKKCGVTTIDNSRAARKLLKSR